MSNLGKLFDDGSCFSLFVVYVGNVPLFVMLLEYTLYH